MNRTRLCFRMMSDHFRHFMLMFRNQPFKHSIINLTRCCTHGDIFGMSSLPNKLRKTVKCALFNVQITFNNAKKINLNYLMIWFFYNKNRKHVFQCYVMNPVFYAF